MTVAMVVGGWVGGVVAMVIVVSAVLSGAQVLGLSILNLKCLIQYKLLWKHIRNHT